MVERLQELCSRINTASSGKIAPDGDSDEALLVTVQTAIERLKEQVPADHSAWITKSYVIQDCAMSLIFPSVWHPLG